MSDATTMIETGLKVLEIVSIVGGGAILLFKLGRVTERVEILISQQGLEITALKASILTFADVITKVAVQNVRLDSQAERIAATERHIDELRRGEGLIVAHQARPRTPV